MRKSKCGEIYSFPSSCNNYMSTNTGESPANYEQCDKSLIILTFTAHCPLKENTMMVNFRCQLDWIKGYVERQ